MSATLLIIDDEDSIRDSLSGILGDEGFNTITAPSAEEGLKMLAQADIDLVLLDIWMPGMDGMEALEEITQSYNIPVIMITTSDNETDINKALEWKINGYITKPFSIKTIISKIEELIN